MKKPHIIFLHLSLKISQFKLITTIWDRKAYLHFSTVCVKKTEETCEYDVIINNKLSITLNFL